AEPLDAATAGVGREQLQQLGAHSPALMIVSDGERDLGGGRIVLQSVVATHSDDAVLSERHQRHPPLVIDRGEVLQLLWVEGPLHSEEPEVTTLRSEALEQVEHQLVVVGPDGPNRDSSPIPQDYVELVLGWISGHDSRLIIPSGQTGPPFIGKYLDQLAALHPLLHRTPPSMIEQVCVIGGEGVADLALNAQERRELAGKDVVRPDRKPRFRRR